MSDISLRFFGDAVEGSTLQQTPLEVSASGDTVVVSGQEGQNIIIYSIFVMAGEAVTVAWKAGAETIIGGCPIAASGGYHLSNALGVAKVDSGENLVINLSGSVAVGGSVIYAFR